MKIRATRFTALLVCSFLFAIIITTDHGRGDDRVGWKSHGASIPGSEYIWIAILGPDTPPLTQSESDEVTQSQIAATVAAALAEDFAATDGRIAPALPGAFRSR